MDVLMNDANVEDVSLDGTNIPIFAYHRKFEFKLTMVGENWNVGSVQTYVFYIGIIHQDVHSTVAMRSRLR